MGEWGGSLGFWVVARGPAETASPPPSGRDVPAPAVTTRGDQAARPVLALRRFFVFSLAGGPGVTRTACIKDAGGRRRHGDSGPGRETAEAAPWRETR